MSNIHWTACLALSLSAFLAGCDRAPTVPKKEVQVPAGGPPVLTKEELAAQEQKQQQEPGRFHVSTHGGLAQASFDEPITETVEPKLLKPLEQWTEQEAAADALGRIGAPAVPELVQALDSPDPRIRERAVQVLGRMGPDAAAAVPALVRLLDDPDPAVRKATTRTLGQIGPAAKDAVPALMRTLMDKPQ